MRYGGVAGSGTPMIQQVTVLFVRGGSQVIKMNARMPRGTGEILRLNNEPISRIVVYTDPRYGGAFALYGTHGRGNSFDVSRL